MGFKKFYNYCLILESINLKAFQGRGFEIPTSNNPIVVVKNPVPSDLNEFPSYKDLDGNDRTIKGFVDGPDLYIVDAYNLHEDIIENDPRFENMIAIYAIIGDTEVLIAGSGAVIHHTAKQKQIIKNHHQLKSLFPGKKILEKMSVDEKELEKERGQKWVYKPE